MRQLQRFGLAAVMGVALVALTLATPASARKFQMSGDWIIRNGQVFIPLQFATAVMDPMAPPPGVVHISMGNLTGAFFFPNGPMPVLGGVTAQGSNPASIMVPLHVNQNDVAAAVPLAGETLVQITTNFGVDAPYEPATLAANGGPGDFTWCPNDVACTHMVGGMRSTDPPNGGLRNGRIIYNAGANQFGGTLQIGLARGGYTTMLFNPSPYRVGYNKFGGAGATIRNLAPGKGGFGSTATEMVFLERAFVTQPTMVPPPFNLILYPGPKVTVGMGVSNTGTGAIYYLPAIGLGPMGTLAGQITSNYGFGHTTGTVFGQQTIGTGGQDFFTFMGSDSRTALGAGNITTVAGGVSYRNTLINITPYASMHRFKVTLGAPIPSMSPAGFAVAGALMLLAVGYGLRRRIR